MSISKNFGDDMPEALNKVYKTSQKFDTCQKITVNVYVYIAVIPNRNVFLSRAQNLSKAKRDQNIMQCMCLFGLKFIFKLFFVSFRATNDR